MSTTSHDSLCAWLMPVVDFAKLSLGDDVTPVLVFDRGGAFPETMSELRDAGAEFVTYERKPYPELGATEFKQSLTITLASAPRRPTRIAYTEAPRKNLRGGRGRVRRIALLTEEGQQVNLLAISELPAEALIRGHLARWGLQENQQARRSRGGRGARVGPGADRFAALATTSVVAIAAPRHACTIGAPGLPRSLGGAAQEGLRHRRAGLP
jgi:hypothetical protein